MDRASYKKHRPYAGEKVSSMKRRCLDHDYCDRGMYMVTLAVKGRRQLLGDVVGVSTAAPDSAEAPRMVPSPLGLAVQACWEAIPHFHPEVKTVALQLMPDHLHGILFVTRRMAVQLGQVVLGFKQGCNKAYRAIVKGVDDGSAAVIRQHTEGQRDRRHGFLFETGYNDRLLLRDGQLQNWKDYLADNPRRLLAKREHPDLFRVRKNICVGDRSFTALGNRFLLERPEKRQVQISRRLTSDEIEQQVASFLSEAEQGAVLVSPAISLGEKAVMRAALDRQMPLIFLTNATLTPFDKPGGEYIEACGRGDLLILAPWDDKPYGKVISREECNALNIMAENIAEAAVVRQQTKQKE